MLFAVAGLVFASELVAAQGGRRWYAYGYNGSWSNGVRGTLTTYSNGLSNLSVFVAIYTVIIFPNMDWFSVGYFIGRSACGIVTSPTYFVDQAVGGVYSCGLYTDQHPSVGTDSAYEVYDVPGTTQWNAVINLALVRTTTFLYAYGNGYGYGESNGDSNQMNGWFKSMQYGRVRGGTTLWWYDWTSLYTYQDYPYYVTVISSKEFKTASQTH